MLQILKTTLFTNILLFHLFVIGCDCRKSPEEKEEEELVAKEKKAKEDLKQEFKKFADITQEAWDKLDKALNDIRDNVSVRYLDILIKSSEAQITGTRVNFTSEDKAEFDKYKKYIDAIKDADSAIGVKIPKDKSASENYKKFFLHFVEIFKNFREQAKLKNRGKK